MECAFCGYEIPHGKERIFVNKKGELFRFCSKKCEKNLLKLRRKPREVRWTKAYWDEKNIRLKLKSQEETKRQSEQSEKKEIKQERSSKKPAKKLKNKKKK